MAPKKKGKGSATGKKKAEERSRGEPVTEESKEFYQLQIRDLEGRLERYQNKWDEICAKDSQFQAQFDQLSNDKKEIVSFLKRTLNQRMDEIADLNDQLTGLQEAKDGEKEAYEAQLGQVRSESQEKMDRLTSENMLLAGKLASLEEFRVQKEELMTKFAALEEKLRSQDEERKQMMYDLEKKAVLDKDRLKKEMVQRVNTVAAEFRRVSNNQMAETTKRAIRENVAIGSQLAKMSDKSMELINENDLLKERESQLHKQLVMLEENEKELVKKSLSNQKVIRMLTEKCQQQQVMLDIANQKEHELLELHADHQTLQEEAETLRQRMFHLEEEVQRLIAEKDKVIGELEEEKKTRQMVDRVLMEAASSLKDVLMETPKIEGDDPESTLLVTQNQLLEKLLVILNSAATLGLGPALDDFQSRDNQSTDLHITPKANRHLVSPTLKGPGVSPHYRIGDLGLVPRQNTTGGVISRIGMLSRTTRLGPIQAYPGIGKDRLSISQEDRLPKQSALPGISSTSGNNISKSEKWKFVTGSFAALNITGMSSTCPKSQDGLLPTAHLADGTADLIILQKCNPLQFLKYLNRHTNGKDQFAFPNVEVHRIHAMRFTPEQLDDEEIVRRQKRMFVCPCGEESVTSTWNCDGEILDCAQLSIRVHHQLIQLFARGIEDKESR